MDDGTNEIAKALVAIAKAMPNLRKGDRNAHGDYAYVSIDDFYEHAATVVIAHGLTWKIRETAYETFETQGRNRVEVQVRTSYEVDLIHETGEQWRSFFCATITHPLQGAQTAGSSMSYLDKLFLRTTFHIVTGEKDADATDNAVFASGPADAGRGKGRAKGQTEAAVADDPFGTGAGHTPTGAEAVRPADDAKGDDKVPFLTLATLFVEIAANEADLTQYWNDNEAAFNTLKAEDAAGYKTLIAAFKAKKLKLKGAEA